MVDVTSALVAVFGRVLGAQALIGAVMFVGFRLHAHRVVSQGGTVERQMYRLRRAWQTVTPLSVVGAVVVTVITVSTARPYAAPILSTVDIPPRLWLAPVFLIYVGSIATSSALATLARHRTVREVKGGEPDTRAAVRNVAKVYTVRWGLIVLAIFVVLVAPAGWHAVALGLSWTVYRVVKPFVFEAIEETRPVEGAFRERFDELCAERDVSIRDVRRFGGDSRLAQAVLLGLVGPTRTVYLSEYLVEHLNPDERDAIVAYSLGELVNRHDVLQFIAVAFPIVLWVFVLEHTSFFVAMLVAVVFFVPYAVLYGRFSHRVVFTADARAAELVSPEAIAGAIETLGELNAIDRQTGTLYNLLVAHPSLEARLERLETATSP